MPISGQIIDFQNILIPNSLGFTWIQLNMTSKNKKIEVMKISYYQTLFGKNRGVLPRSVKVSNDQNFLYVGTNPDGQIFLFPLTGFSKMRSQVLENVDNDDLLSNFTLKLDDRFDNLYQNPHLDYRQNLAGVIPENQGLVVRKKSGMFQGVYHNQPGLDVNEKRNRRRMDIVQGMIERTDMSDNDKGDWTTRIAKKFT